MTPDTIVAPTPTQTWRELADEQIAMELLEAEEQFAEIRGERDTLRELLQVALDQLHALTVTRDRDHARYVALLNELRALRGTETRKAA
jgi:hypothetical protein